MYIIEIEGAYGIWDMGYGICRLASSQTSGPVRQQECGGRAGGLWRISRTREDLPRQYTPIKVGKLKTFPLRMKIVSVY